MLPPCLTFIMLFWCMCFFWFIIDLNYSVTVPQFQSFVQFIVLKVSFNHNNVYLPKIH